LDERELWKTKRNHFLPQGITVLPLCVPERYPVCLGACVLVMKIWGAVASRGILGPRAEVIYWRQGGEGEW
jgi:hypothetical protein